MNVYLSIFDLLVMLLCKLFYDREGEYGKAIGRRVPELIPFFIVWHENKYFLISVRRLVHYRVATGDSLSFVDNSLIPIHIPE